MPTRPLRVALLVSLSFGPLATPAWGDSVAPGTAFVIGAGQEALFLEMANPAPAKFAGTYALDGVSLDKDRATLTYVDGKGAKVQVALCHPGASSGAALGTTLRFAVVPGAGPVPPRPLVEAVTKRVREHEARFQWTQVTPSAEAPSTAPPSPPPLRSMPILPVDAVTPELLRGPAYALSPAEEKRFAEGVKLAAAGPSEALRAIVRELQSSSVPAAAALLRKAGDGHGAAELLAGTVEKADGRTHDDRALELGASLLEDGREGDAERVLAGLHHPPEGGPRCLLAAAFTQLLVDGQAALVMKRTAGDWAAGPRCIHRLRMRAAMAVRDDQAVDAAAGAAAQANPRDENLLYMWGSYYYNHSRFAESQRGWDRLAAVNPAFPGFLGLYGTAVHIQGKLHGAFLDGYIDRARKDPDDVVANHLAGLGVYYQKKYDQSLRFFGNVRRHSDEPRAGMYLAMSRFFTGDVEGAIQLSDELEPMAFREPDIYYCRSLIWRFYDLPRAIREMQAFLDVNALPERLAFGPEKVAKAKDDIVRMKRGEVPSVYLPGMGSYVPPPRQK